MSLRTVLALPNASNTTLLSSSTEMSPSVNLVIFMPRLERLAIIGRRISLFAWIKKLITYLEFSVLPAPDSPLITTDWLPALSSTLSVESTVSLAAEEYSDVIMYARARFAVLNTCGARRSLSSSTTASTD